jgi:hypothetical protein
VASDPSPALDRLRVLDLTCTVAGAYCAKVSGQLATPPSPPRVVEVPSLEPSRLPSTASTIVQLRTNLARLRLQRALLEPVQCILSDFAPVMVDGERVAAVWELLQVRNRR